MTAQTAPVAELKLIYRQVSFSLPAFDHLKAWQRHWESTEGRRMTNSEALDRLIFTTPAP